MAKFFLENACAFGIDLNSKDDSGLTGFYYACSEGHSDLVKIFMENAADLSIDLNARGNDGLTGFHQACIHGHTDLVNIFMENAVELNIDIDTKDDSYLLKPMELTKKLQTSIEMLNSWN